MASGELEQAGGAKDVELARALVPVLLERIEGSTRRLGRIEARLAHPAGDADDASEELGLEAGEADGLGWLLGWIAGGLGAELLLERHEPRALELALELVGAALARRGVTLVVPGAAQVTREGGWRLAWAVAGLAWRAAQAAGSELTLRLTPGSATSAAALTGEGEASAALRARACALAHELPGTRLVSDGRSWSWTFPSAWLEASA